MLSQSMTSIHHKQINEYLLTLVLSEPTCSLQCILSVHMLAHYLACVHQHSDVVLFFQPSGNAYYKHIQGIVRLHVVNVLLQATRDRLTQSRLEKKHKLAMAVSATIVKPATDENSSDTDDIPLSCLVKPKPVGKLRNNTVKSMQSVQSVKTK